MNLVIRYPFVNVCEFDLQYSESSFSMEMVYVGLLVVYFPSCSLVNTSLS